MKKILSLVLVLSLVLGTFSFAFAATPEDVVDTDFEEAVETLMALGVVNGYPDGTYKPEKAVTRAEMSKLLVEALGYGELAAGANSTFADAQGHWAESYIGFAASMDIVKGYPDGTFKPDAVMSTDEAITMVVRALGYTDDSLKGTWPTNYKVKALDLDLTDGLTSLSGDGLRGNVALLLFNALEVPMVEVDSDGNAVKVDPEKLFIDNIGEKTPNFVKITYDKVFDEDDALTVADNINLEDYLYHSIKYYITDDYDVAYISDVDTDEFTGTLITSGTSIVVEDADDKQETFTVTSQTALFLNGEKASDTDVTEINDDGKAELTVVYSTDENDNKVVEGIKAWVYTEFQAATEYSVRKPLQLDRDNNYPLPAMLNDDDEVVLDESDLIIEGDVDELSEIKVDDLVYYYASDDEDVDGDMYPDKVKLLVVRDTFEGKYTKKVDSNTFVIGGTTFDRSSDVASLSITLGDDYKLFLDKDGDIYAVTDATEADVDTNYALFINVDTGDVEDISGVRTLDTAPTVRLFTSGGDAVVYDLDTDKLKTEAKTTNNWDTDVAAGVVTLGSITFEYDATSLVITPDAVGVGLGDLVTYELNSDGQLDKLELATTKGALGTNYDTDEMVLADSYDVTDNTVIFDKSSVSWDDWEVVGESFLSSNMTGEYAVNEDDWFVEAMVVFTGGDTTDTSYAIITDVQDVYDTDQDAAVQEVSVLVGGEELSYNTIEGYDVTGDAEYVTLSAVRTLTIDDDGYLTDIDAPSGTNDGNALTVSAIEGMKLRADDGVRYTIADDASVYILEWDATNSEWDAEVTDFNSILVDDNVKLYDYDSDLGYGIVVIELQ